MNSLPRLQIRVVDKSLTDGVRPVVEVLMGGEVVGLLPAREVRFKVKPGHLALAEVDLDCTVQAETVRLS